MQLHISSHMTLAIAPGELLHWLNEGNIWDISRNHLKTHQCDIIVRVNMIKFFEIDKDHVSLLEQKLIACFIGN